MAESPDMPLSQARAAFLEFGLLPLHPSTPQDPSCPICLDNYTFEHRPVIIKDVCGCRHVFGEACLEMWLRTSNTCPICRAVLYFLPHLPSRRHINNTFWEEVLFMLTMVVHPQAQEIMEGSHANAADDYPLPAEEGYIVGRNMFLERIFRQRQQQRQTPLMTGLWLFFVVAWESAVNLLQAVEVHFERILERDRLNRLQVLRSNASLPDWDDEWMESDDSDSGSETHTDPQPSSTAETGTSAPEVSGKEDEDPGIMLVWANADSDIPDGCSEFDVCSEWSIATISTSVSTLDLNQSSDGIMDMLKTPFGEDMGDSERETENDADADATSEWSVATLATSISTLDLNESRDRFMDSLQD